MVDFKVEDFVEVYRFLVWYFFGICISLCMVDLCFEYFFDDKFLLEGFVILRLCIRIESF